MRLLPPDNPPNLIRFARPSTMTTLNEKGDTHTHHIPFPVPCSWNKQQQEKLKRKTMSRIPHVCSLLQLNIRKGFPAPFHILDRRKLDQKKSQTKSIPKKEYLNLDALNKLGTRLQTNCPVLKKDKSENETRQIRMKRRRAQIYI